MNTVLNVFAVIILVVCLFCIVNIIRNKHSKKYVKLIKLATAILVIIIDLLVAYKQYNSDNENTEFDSSATTRQPEVTENSNNNNSITVSGNNNTSVTENSNNNNNNSGAIVNGDNNQVIVNSDSTDDESNISTSITQLYSFNVLLKDGREVSLSCDDISPAFLLDINYYSTYSHRIDKVYANVLEYDKFSVDEIAEYYLPAGGADNDYYYVIADITPDLGRQEAILDMDSRKYITLDAKRDTTFYVDPYFSEAGHYKIQIEFTYKDKGEEKIISSDPLEFYYIPGRIDFPSMEDSNQQYSFIPDDSSTLASRLHIDENAYSKIKDLNGEWTSTGTSDNKPLFTVAVNEGAFRYNSIDESEHTDNIVAARFDYNGYYYIIQGQDSEYVLQDNYEKGELSRYNSNYPDLAKYDSDRSLVQK